MVVLDIACIARSPCERFMQVLISSQSPRVEVTSHRGEMGQLPGPSRHESIMFSLNTLCVYSNLFLSIGDWIGLRRHGDRQGQEGGCIHP